jgi:hypothetical protein
MNKTITDKQQREIARNPNFCQDARKKFSCTAAEIPAVAPNTL